MIYGKLSQPEHFQFLLAQDGWKRSFDWLLSMPASPDIGRYPIMGDDIYAMVMRYDTVAPNDSNFESHRRYIDLQYTISGGEFIAWEESSDLDLNGDYDLPRDLQFYYFRYPLSKVWMAPGRFSIYYPSDAHLPKIVDGHNAFVYKAVIKIARKLVD